MNELELFDFRGNQVRVVLDEHGEPLFVLNDLCAAMGLTNPSVVARRLDPDALSQAYPIQDSLGRTQHPTVVDESGMYEVILRSDRPEAVDFRRWVTREVLPAIRRHGGYLTPAAAEQALTDPDFIIRLATDLKTERAKREELEAARAVDAPKVVFADAVAVSKTNILVGELAKILRGNGIDIGQNRMFAVLRANGFLINRKGTDWNMPTQRAMDLGLFRIKETTVTHADGHTTISKTPKVTGKGQQYFIERFLDGRLPGKEVA